MAYVYKIFNKKYNKFYIGSRSENTYKNDLFIKYFTSSKVIQDIILNEGINDFSITEIYDFASYKEAVEYENILLQSINNKDDFFNINFSAGGQVIKSKTHTFITNGKIRRQHDRNIPIPKGYKEEWPFKPPSRKGFRMCINLQTEEKEWFHISNIPENWITLKEFKKLNKIITPKPTIWCNNGILCKVFHNEYEIPEGWVKGKLKTEKMKQGWISTGIKHKGKPGFTKDKISITNGIKNRYINKNCQIPEGWVKGVTIHKKRIKGMKIWINDSINNKQILKTEEIPEGWNRGKIHSKKKSIKNIKIFKKDKVSGMLGRIHINNGFERKRF